MTTDKCEKYPEAEEETTQDEGKENVRSFSESDSSLSEPGSSSSDSSEESEKSCSRYCCTCGRKSRLRLECVNMRFA